MAALAFCVCSAIGELYDLSRAFVRCGYDLRKSVRYLRNKRQLEVFNRYSRELWLRRALSRYLQHRKSAKATTEDCCDSLDSYRLQDHQIAAMSRDGIDFAAIEATAEACEAFDTFTVVGRRNDPNLSGFLESERHHTDSIENLDDIEVLNAYETDASYCEYQEAAPVYHNDQIGTLFEGISFKVTGRILRDCERFSINFVIENEHRDIALHINPRLPQNYIVRNSRVRKVWGREEVASALPFTLRRGQMFSIQVLVTDESYMISVNGYHFAKFYHRLPFDEVRTIEVKGDVENVHVERLTSDHYPERLVESEPRPIKMGRTLRQADDRNACVRGEDVEDGPQIPTEWKRITLPSRSTLEPVVNQENELKLPYYGLLPPKALTLGRSLKVEGRVRLLPQSFYINLQQGSQYWPHPIIAMHLNPRFSKQSTGAIGKATIIRNAWHDGKWGVEERSELDTGFRPGKTFSLSIVCGSDKFEIWLNHKLLTEFKYRVNPDIVDTVYIQGDIKLWNVVLQPNISFERLETEE